MKKERMKKNGNILLEELVEGNAELIPIISSQEESYLSQKKVPETLPVLTLRRTVLFPAIVIPVTAERKKSIQLINDAYRNDTKIAIVSQVLGDIEDPSYKDIYKVGTMGKIMKTFQMPDGSVTAIIQGLRKVKLTQQVSDTPYLTANVIAYEDKPLPKSTKKVEALVQSIKDLAIQIIENNPQIPKEATFALHNISSKRYLVNYVISNTNTNLEFKQELLEEKDFLKRANRILETLSNELQILELKNKIQQKTKIDIDKQQKDYFLHQQLKAIQEELGGNSGEQDFQDLKEKASKKEWDDATEEIFQKELSKLKRMNPQAPDYSVQLNYLDFFVDLPWNKLSKDDINLRKARKILDRDHYGLEEVKERIIEHLAVIKLKDDLKSPILCFVGPPGVGKTSLGKSIAEALNRNYIRMSLGGVRDESELRGHRKTYIGAMPGRILKNLKKAGTSNPVFILDEIDKVLGATHSGDPQAALLEILDPEQNTTFHDNFLEVDYDLSKVMFIATANTLSTIHPALIDRMEIIPISGYLVEEKIQIATKHLVAKQLKEHGVKKNEIIFSKAVIRTIIENYTREAGVRHLEQNIAKIIRKRVIPILEKKTYTKRLGQADIRKMLGAPPFSKEIETNFDIPGVVTGLAWTSVGGEILFIEVSLSEGKGKFSLTGNLGEVMKESAQLAFAFLKAHSKELDIDPDLFTQKDVHIHIPAGATPKDGPSAGITLLTALASAFTGKIVKKNLAMTGEITLRGHVLPVGGVKEKILAAKRAKINNIIISEENKKNIDEIPEQYIQGITFKYVENMMEVIQIALQ
jgi:ATP-dependent Lon protease